MKTKTKIWQYMIRGWREEHLDRMIRYITAYESNKPKWNIGRIYKSEQFKIGKYFFTVSDTLGMAFVHNYTQRNISIHTKSEKGCLAFYDSGPNRLNHCHDQEFIFTDGYDLVVVLYKKYKAEAKRRGYYVDTMTEYGYGSSGGYHYGKWN